MKRTLGVCGVSVSFVDVWRFRRDTNTFARQPECVKIWMTWYEKKSVKDQSILYNGNLLKSTSRIVIMGICSCEMQWLLFNLLGYMFGFKLMLINFAVEISLFCVL